MSFTSASVLELLVAGVRALNPAQVALASLTGKREGLFRDALMSACASSMPQHLARAEWRIPPAAVARWKKTRFAGDRAQGIVDFVLLSNDDLLTEVPTLAVEFKLWYWFDALNPKKYVKSGKSNHHLISNSFLADASKLQAVSPAAPDGRLVITVVPTFHTDEIRATGENKPRQQLAALGFPYSGLGLIMPNSTYPTSHIMRSEALKRIANYFERQESPTICGGGLVGEFGGVAVTTDFVVSAVPPLT